MSKRTLDGFFAPKGKKPKLDEPSVPLTPTTNSSHPTYPFPIPNLPPEVTSEFEMLVTAEGKSMTDQPHLDLLYFQPFIPRPCSTTYFHFLRSQLPFYRVIYTISRFGKETVINTPRWTTVFGVDDTSLFTPTGTLIEASPATNNNNADPRPIARDKYKCRPRPIPECLDLLRRVTEAATDTQYNFCLVNYYASGTDSISFHSDDERFLGLNPAIASFSLGARRDFLMKHKPPPPPPPPAKEGAQASAGDTAAAAAAAAAATPTTRPIKMPLGSGDMVLMRGETQSNWLHSIPKRTGKGAEAERGRINITFRRARVVGGTENYYRYNVGEGPVHRWDASRREMGVWKGEAGTGG